MPDILISMNKTTDKLWKYADEWEKTPEHFDGVNPFCVAIHAVRQTTNASELPNEQKHGHWIVHGGRIKKNVDNRIVECTVCNNFLSMSGVNGGRGNANYCPNCGAKMDGKVEQDG